MEVDATRRTVRILISTQVAIIKTHCTRHLDEPAADLGGFPAWLTTPFALFFEMLMILIFPMEIHELRKDGELVGISTTCAAA